MIDHRISRRRLIHTLATAPLLPFSERIAQCAAPDWNLGQAILKRISAPSFPARDFPIVKFGAAADGKADCTAAIAKAIHACSAAGGGRVTVPPGRFLTGAIHLLSNVNLHLAEGATLLFIQDPKAYLPLVFTRWEGTECMNYSSLIYAYDQRNIAVTGKGTLDGQADEAHWWPWKGRRGPTSAGAQNQNAARDKLLKMGDTDVPVKDRLMGEGAYLRPQFIQPYRCQNVLIEGVRIINSPMWEINPVLCRNVIVRDVTVVTHGPNNDGCDPECSSDVLIEGCKFDTGDDCIAIKSGRNHDGRRVNVPSENILIRNCEMKDGHGGVTIGSEASGGVRNVFAENCKMDSPHLDRALRLKTNAVRGGFIENVYMRNVTVGQVADAVVHADFYYEEGPNGKFPPRVGNINVRDVTCEKAKYAVYMRAFENAPITGVTLENCDFRQVASPNRLEHVNGLRMTKVRINGQPAA